MPEFKVAKPFNGRSRRWRIGDVVTSVDDLGVHKFIDLVEQKFVVREGEMPVDPPIDQPIKPSSQTTAKPVAG